jgi:hypothetical protein
VIKRDQEVFIALVPRVVRKFQINEENTRPVAAGTDQVIKLTYSPVGSGSPVGNGAAPAPTGTAPAQPEGAGVVPVAPVAPVAPGSPGTSPALPPLTETPFAPTAEGQASLGSPTRGESLSRGASATPDAPGGRSGRSVVNQQGGRTTIAGQEVGAPEVSRATPPGSAPAATLRFTPPGLVVQTGSLFTLVLDSQQLQDFHNASFTVEFDPKVLQLKEVRQGSLLAASGKNFGLESKPNNTDGEAQIIIKLPEGEAGVSANGSLAVLQFEAVGAGNTNVLVADLAPRNAKGETIARQSPAANIRVQ